MTKNKGGTVKTQDILMLTDMAIYARERLWNAYKCNKSAGAEVEAELALQELLRFERKLRQIPLPGDGG